MVRPAATTHPDRCCSGVGVSAQRPSANADEEEIMLSSALTGQRHPHPGLPPPQVKSSCIPTYPYPWFSKHISSHVPGTLFSPTGSASPTPPPRTPTTHVPAVRGQVLARVAGRRRRKKYESPQSTPRPFGAQPTALLRRRGRLEFRPQGTAPQRPLWAESTALWGLKYWQFLRNPQAPGRVGLLYF
jgi:hypothetical protein